MVQTITKHFVEDLFDWSLDCLKKGHLKILEEKGLWKMGIEKENQEQ